MSKTIDAYLNDVDSPQARRAVCEVLNERIRQDKKWGQQNHEPFTWIAVLAEEVGEASQAALHREFGGPEHDSLMKELIQVAAVALAMVECGYRNGWPR